jgi:L-Lysine epsilon oxidase N-terminal/L-lysine epsilon oxidase C-terminal domain
MATIFRIHPAIGIARLGNSPASFYLAPEATGGLPIDCDADGISTVADGKEQPVGKFKDSEGRIRRQAARFRVFVYNDVSADGREVKIGDEFDIVDRHSGQRRHVRIDDIHWTVYLANKKASWYEFQETAGEHGYSTGHKLRNANISDTEERQKLIIDPGPRSVWFQDPKHRRANFAQGTSQWPETFPPPLVPNSVTTLGELRCTQQDNTNRLLVLGGFGNSGSMKQQFGNPKIENYANNDGWFDDISDGPVTASLAYTVLQIDGQKPPAQWTTGSIAVDDPAWVIVGYPRYAPQITDIITMDDLIFDVGVRYFGYAPFLYGILPFDGTSHHPTPDTDLALWRGLATWNTGYKPYFQRDIRPILERPGNYSYVMDLDPTTGGDPHETGPGGNLDIQQLSIPPHEGEDPADRQRRRDMRMFVYHVLRKAGQENDLFAPSSSYRPGARLFAMPLLCGDNPLTNVAPSKFLRLTDTMLFLIRQWAEGHFIDEEREAIVPLPLHPGAGPALDRGVLGNALGGSFCPGAEASWIMRNPGIYSNAYRIRHAVPTPGVLSQPANLPGGAPQTAVSLGAGLEPGDITKYSGVPWQSDFNECSTQPIDITYRDWNNIDPASIGDPASPLAPQLTYWWPAHRPMIVNGTPWSPTYSNNAGDLLMVRLWATRGFIVRAAHPGPLDPAFVLTETDE